MSNTATHYKQTAELYHGFGANVVAIGYGDPEKNEHKSPNHKYTKAPNDYKARPQTFDEVQALPWNRAYGLGIIAGVNGWRCVDFDGIKNADGIKQPVPFEVVATFCQALNLNPNEYPWVERSGENGWHVFVLCPDELNGDEYAGVTWGKLQPRDEYAGLFDHAELRYRDIYTIVAPSVLCNGATYEFKNCEQPTEPPATVGLSALVDALRAVVEIPTNPGTHATVARITDDDGPATDRNDNVLDDPNATYYDPKTGVTWATLDEYERDEQRAKDEARQRFDMVQYIEKHLGTNHTKTLDNGETRIGKPGAGYGGWHVTKDGKTWNTFRDGATIGATAGGDCFALVAYCQYNVWKASALNANQWQHVLEIVEHETGVRIPRRQRATRSTVERLATTAGNDDGNQGPTRRNVRRDKPTKVETALEFLEPFRFRRNDLNGVIEWQPTAGNAETWHELNDDQIASWLVELELSTGVSVPMDRFGYCIISKTTTYDPIRDYFDGLPRWDGSTDHVRALCSTVQTTDPELFYDHVRKWLIGAYATAYYGAITHKTVNELLLILQGEQGTGKTTFLTRLVPAPLQRYRHIGAIDNDKDGKMLQTETFIWINDELDGLRKREVTQVKTILSNTQYRYRRPYAESNKLYKRRVSFCGSTNEDAFLTDHTGTRRFLVHTVASVDLDALRDVDINGVWSHVRELHENGERHWLNADDIARQRAQNERFVEVQYVDGLLSRYFKITEPYAPGADHLTTNEIAQRIAELYDEEHTITETGEHGDRSVRDGTKRPDPERLTQPLGRALKKLGYVRAAMKRIGRSTYGYWVVELSKLERVTASVSVVSAGPNSNESLTTAYNRGESLTTRGGFDEVPF